MPDDQPRAPTDLQAIWRVLRRRWLVIVLCTLLVPAAAAAFSLLHEKQYTATASLLFRNPELAQQVFGTDFVQEQNDDPERDAATNLQLVGLQAVATRTARALGPGFRSGEIR